LLLEGSITVFERRSEGGPPPRHETPVFPGPHNVLRGVYPKARNERRAADLSVLFPEILGMGFIKVDVCERKAPLIKFIAAFQVAIMFFYLAVAKGFPIDFLIFAFTARCPGT
jgi:hypothetical protein